MVETNQSAWRGSAGDINRGSLTVALILYLYIPEENQSDKLSFNLFIWLTLIVTYH